MVTGVLANCMARMITDSPAGRSCLLITSCMSHLLPNSHTTYEGKKLWQMEIRKCPIHVHMHLHYLGITVNCWNIHTQSEIKIHFRKSLAIVDQYKSMIVYPANNSEENDNSLITLKELVQAKSMIDFFSDYPAKQKLYCHMSSVTFSNWQHRLYKFILRNHSFK